jgi:hypothetical protein
MNTRVTLVFIHDGPDDELQPFLDHVKRGLMLNAGDNEETPMISIRDFQYRTDAA